ncbi:MarR family winged helix-turn-helix transcriptional regulator [Flavobacterium sp. DG1-102-2]|uniref:MarR family winged helix-turn-helix transcriptional regulator n=1 Tax=Flavobacterium sp. DG1-102-2 TaxID=3081663 RepID=UPI002948FB5B|nr:MarR family winged helix-turn-helix transcriptional regulator [Flavobacterium sp. DG1-102-2]MDV6167001.1 MarR family winged helix-turn-helix transcriptional regulator [Flavobacterium sp. DG1-102-2]
MPRIKELHGHEISYEMFQVIYVLWRKNEVNQQEIANAVQKGKASITPLIDNLCRIKLVTRTEDINDRRNKIISLTPEGKLYKQKFDPLMKEFYNIFQGDIPDGKIREVMAILLQASNNLNK